MKIPVEIWWWEQRRDGEGGPDAAVSTPTLYVLAVPRAGEFVKLWGYEGHGPGPYVVLGVEHTPELEANPRIRVQITRPAKG
jgi:hypothetical protein